MIAQLAIAIFGVTAIWLSQSDNEETRKYACLFGLCSQPFWFYTSYTSEQWGIFFVSFFYLSAWIKGFYTNWIAK